MEYKVALDPSLDLKTEEFVERWNSSEEHHKVAKAHLEEGKGELLDPTGTTLAILGGVAIGVMTNALYDLIKKLVAKEESTVSYKLIKQSDGTNLIVITKGK